MVAEVAFELVVEGSDEAGGPVLFLLREGEGLGVGGLPVPGFEGTADPLPVHGEVHPVDPGLPELPLPRAESRLVHAHGGLPPRGAPGRRPRSEEPNVEGAHRLLLGCRGGPGVLHRGGAGAGPPG